MSGSYIIRLPGAAFVTDHVTGTVTLTPGIPITEATAPVSEAALLPSLISDSEAVYTAIVGAIPSSAVLPFVFDDADASRVARA